MSETMLQMMMDRWLRRLWLMSVFLVVAWAWVVFVSGTTGGVYRPMLIHVAQGAIRVEATHHRRQPSYILNDDNMIRHKIGSRLRQRCIRIRRMQRSTHRRHRHRHDCYHRQRWCLPNVRGGGDNGDGENSHNGELNHTGSDPRIPPMPLPNDPFPPPPPPPPPQRLQLDRSLSATAQQQQTNHNEEDTNVESSSSSSSSSYNSYDNPWPTHATHQTDYVDEEGSSWAAVDQTMHHRPSTPPIVIPPPPPPPPLPPPPPPALSHLNNGENHPEWMIEFEQQQPQQQQQYPHQQHHQLQQQQQEQEMLQRHIHNLTTLMGALEQREAWHVRQLNVLTEHFMRLESTAAHERLQYIESQYNCTALFLQCAALTLNVSKWQRACDALTQHAAVQADTIRSVKNELRESHVQTEELAQLIENHRLRRSKEEEENEKEQEKRRFKSASPPIKFKPKKTRFWSWLFGWREVSMDAELDTLDDDDDDDDTESLNEVYTIARSTLLSALQNARDSVDELETMVANLQQNNSAIIKQVKSRDLIVDELNVRIAVFEEEKIVLKAALKQLQHDLNAQAPKTQKLANDLKNAQSDVEKLKKEIKGLISTHQDEVQSLRQTISSKEDSISKLESNLTIMGTYVDRLESRLIELALARRDIEERESACTDTAASADQVKAERDVLQTNVTELQSEHEELRTLLKELADERVKLLAKNQDLASEVVALKKHKVQIQEALAKLTNEYNELVVADKTLKNKLEQFEIEACEKDKQSMRVQDRLKTSESQMADLRQRMEREFTDRQMLVDQLRIAETNANRLQHRLELLQATNSELSENATRMQQQLQVALHNRSDLSSIKERELSIHLVDVMPASHLFTSAFRLSTNLSHFVANLAPSQVAVDDRPSNLTTASRILVPDRPQKLTSPILSTSTHSPPKLNTSTGTTLKKPSLLSSRRPNSVLPPAFPHLRAVASFRDDPEYLVDAADPAIVTPLRSIRKLFAKATGLHGVFTKNYKNRKTQATLPDTKTSPPLEAIKSPKLLIKTGFPVLDRRQQLGAKIQSKSPPISPPPPPPPPPLHSDPQHPLRHSEIVMKNPSAGTLNPAKGHLPLSTSRPPSSNLDRSDKEQIMTKSPDDESPN